MFIYKYNAVGNILRLKLFNYVLKIDIFYFFLTRVILGADM